MSRMGAAFAELARRGEGAYIPYVCMGDPDRDFTLSLAGALFDSGADIIELGVPFSDPVADGPVIQGAMNRSLENGFRVSEVFRTVESIRREGHRQPIVLMTYANPVMRMGTKEFCSRAARSGADAVLMVDMPIEESGLFDSHAKENGLDVIRLATPSTDDARLAELLSRASGFLYAVSEAGVTGARSRLPESATTLLRRASAASGIPVVLGFGISAPDQVREAIAAGASGVVEGSALVSAYAPYLDDRPRALREVAAHAAEMKEATRRP
ncbi:MAG: tryptophan synthase subunit alpha [Candidatus Thermoplasmatota archaeon]